MADTERKPIYFKDVLESCTNWDEVMKLLPCMVCHEYKDKWAEDPKETQRKSYSVLGFGPDYIILGSNEAYYSYDEDNAFSDNYIHTEEYTIVKFKDLTKAYIWCNPPTEGQRKWLEEHEYDTDSISGYEAWHIMNKATDKQQNLIASICEALNMKNPKLKDKTEAREWISKYIDKYKDYKWEHRWDGWTDEMDAYMCSMYDIPNM